MTISLFLVLVLDFVVKPEVLVLVLEPQSLTTTLVTAHT